MSQSEMTVKSDKFMKEWTSGKIDPILQSFAQQLDVYLDQGWVLKEQGEETVSGFTKLVAVLVHD